MPLKLVSLYKGPNNLNMNVTENRRDKFESKFCKCNRLLPYFGICVNQCSRCTCCSHCILVYCPSTVLRVFPGKLAISLPDFNLAKRDPRKDGPVFRRISDMRAAKRT